MARFIARSSFPVTPAELFGYHERPGALQRLLPPWQSVRVEQPGGIYDGDQVIMRMGLGPVSVRWVAEHRDFEAGRQFRDVQVQGPFGLWDHTHRVLPEGDGGSARLEDEIEYELPAGGLGRSLGGGSVKSMLERMFRFRHLRTRLDLLRQSPFAARQPLRVAITGATGLIGTSLCAFLTTAGHRVIRITRSPRKQPQPAQGAEPVSVDIGWNPAKGELDAAALEGVDAVVHLAGEPIAGFGWSAEKKKSLRESRMAGTKLLAKTLAGLERPPRVLVSASAIGYYGNRGGERLTEESAAGTGFLADLCKDWEAAAHPARDAGIRLVTLRVGLVLSARGGLLATLLPVFRTGAGGRLGDGLAGMSWISLDDITGAIYELLLRDELEGPINATAPHSVTNAEFTRVLGRVLGRPTFLPVPAFAMRALFGEMANETMLSSAFVHPEKLEAAQFRFRLPELENALRLELGKLRESDVEGLEFEHAG